MRYIFLALVLVSALLAACSDDINQDIDEAQADINAAQARVENITASLQQAQADAQEAFAKLETQSSELQSCLQKVGKQDNQTKALIENLGDELAEAHEQLEACEGNEDVISDAARRLCCMKRIDDASIDSYSIEGNRIVCKNDGEKEIDC